MGTIGTKNSFSEPLEPRALVLSENDAKIYFWNFRRPLLSFCNLSMALNFKMLWSTSLWTCYLKTGNSNDLNVFKLFLFHLPLEAILGAGCLKTGSQIIPLPLGMFDSPMLLLPRNASFKPVNWYLGIPNCIPIEQYAHMGS